MTEAAPWVLMVEDDPLFAKIFEHFWKKEFPAVEFYVSGSLGEMRDTLSEAVTDPHLVILDHNLPDGLGSQVGDTLEVRNMCWSALGSGDLRRKPQGRQELEEAVRELGAGVGFSPAN